MVLERVDVIEFDDTGCDLLDKEVDSHHEVLDILRAENFVARVIRLMLSTQILVGLT